MDIVILGGGGFIGQKLVQEIVRSDSITVNGKPHLVSSITLFDKQFENKRVQDSRIRCQEGDLRNASQLNEVLKGEPGLIFHLAAIVSGEAEKNFDLGMQVNLHANLILFEKLKAFQVPPIVIFASSVAVFGGALNAVISDQTAPKPLSSYGTQKAVVDLLLNDYTRRGWIDGRALRLPTIAIRPGKANAATSSFVSSIIREPLHGRTTNCPVTPEISVWIQSPRVVVANFLHAARLDGESFGTDRVIQLPGLTTPIRDLVLALDQVETGLSDKFITWKSDPFIQSIVLTWPPNFQTDRAIALGFKKDASVADIVNAYITDDHPSHKSN